MADLHTPASCKSLGNMIAVTRRSPERDAHGAVHEMTNLGGRRSLLHECASDIFQRAGEIDLLLIMAADRHSRLLSRDGQDRHVVETRIVKSGDQMRMRPGPVCDADAEFAGEFGVGRSHESSHFLMARLDELDLAFGPLQGAEYAVDAVPRITKDFSDAPRMEAFHQEVADGLTHGSCSRMGAKLIVRLYLGNVLRWPPFHRGWRRQRGLASRERSWQAAKKRNRFSKRPLIVQANIHAELPAINCRHYRGICGGRTAIAHRFARAGWTVGLIARDQKALEQVEQEVKGLGGTGLIFPLDVTDAPAMFAAADAAVARCGSIDVWINDAMVTVFSRCRK